jgi:Fe2+ or Zn2+ uptake regulation protein
MAEALTGASRATVQRNLDWMQKRGLIREVTGQGMFRMWRTVQPFDERLTAVWRLVQISGMHQEIISCKDLCIIEDSRRLSALL